MLRWLGDLFARLFRRVLFRNVSPGWLTASCCMGVYVAFCPWVGFHTALVLGSAFLFPFHGAVMLAVSCMINNPWTMMPVYGADYMAGRWAMRFCLGDVCFTNPSWMDWLNIKLHYYVGMPHFSLWAFLIGGNLLGILGAIMLYPVFKHLVSKRADKVMSWVQRLHLSQGDAQ